MIYSRAIKTLKKAGFSVTESSRSFSAQFPGSLQEISAILNGPAEEDQLTCLRVRRCNDRDDCQSDYCAGQWFDSLRNAIAFAKRY